MKKLILALMMLMWGSLLHAQTPSNYGFEDGTYAGWTVSNGSTTLRTSWSDSGNGVQVTTGVQNYCPGGGKCWTVTPYGSYMLSVQAGGNSPQFNAAMTTLGLSSSDITTIRNTIYSNGSMNPTNASSVSRSVFLQAGITYTFAWQYLSTDYVPYNDGSMITLTGGPGVPTLNGQTQNYALLGFTNPGTGNYSTNSYGATGWQVAVFTVPADGNYMLGFSSFNLGDTALSPILFIDQLQGTTSLNGTTFTPVAPNQGSSAPTTPPPPPAERTYPTTSITTNQTIKLGQTNAITSNSMYIQNIGDNNTVNIEQFSRFNAIRGVNGSQAMLINGSNNSITINQGTATTILGNNLAEVKDAGGKSAFFNILGNSNVVTTLQQGTGNHFLDVSAPFGGLNANITQSGSAQKLFKLVINNPGIGVTVSQTSASVTDSVLMSITCATGPCTGYSYVKN